MQSFYIIGKFATKKIIAEKIKEVENMGFENTHNWTLKENYTCPKSEQVKNDINGVKDADIVIAIINNPEYHYRGSFSEIGAAIGLDKTVYLVTDNLESGSASHCFLFHPNIVRFQTWEGLIRFLKRDLIININKN